MTVSSSLDLSNQKKERTLDLLRNSLGPDICEQLDNDDVYEIYVNPDESNPGFGKLFVKTLTEGKKLLNGNFPAERTKNIITIAAGANLSGKETVDENKPALSTELAISGARFQGHLPPIVIGPNFVLRKKASLVFSLESYMEADCLNKEQYDSIIKGINNKANFLIVGATGSGKTTLTNALLKKVSELYPDQRLIIIEDTMEIQCEADDHVVLRVRDHIGVDALTLLKYTMRMSPSRIIVGEIRGKEAHTLIKAWNTGHPGGITTVHADSAIDSLDRLQMLALEDKDANIETLRTLIPKAVNVIVFIQEVGNKRIITEVLEVKGYDKETSEYLFEKY